MKTIETIIQFCTQVLTNVVFVISMYYLCMSFFGIWRIKDKRVFAPKNSFALLIAAHNEEAVIQDIIVSLKRLDYPKELYDIYVIADNCTDKTADIARKKGVIVCERNDKDKRGKGFALEWMFDKLFKMDKSYDAVVIFDADNLASRNFLLEINKEMCQGYKVVQGYLDSKNPEDTWITGSYSIAFWSTNRMFQLARHNMGLSNQLGGTGFAIATDTLKELGWGATCLTEDLEFTCKLVLNGHKVGWAHDAIMYDEKPLTLAQSWKQRKRWMQGFADVSGKYFFKLLKVAIKERSFTALDCALYSINPFIVVLMGLAALMSVTRHILNIYDYFFGAMNFITHMDSVVYTMDINMVKIGVILLMVLQIAYTPFILILEKKFNFKIFLYYLIYPIYSITWLPICIQGIIDKDQKEWSHTVHTRSVNITDLEKAN